ncbi:MAG: hypothetical protein BWY17_04633 [Deltaproteobacteria bacterium ADurb.Bin207]|nr:MAG: hypothetical protein BWY17_04633 [Deltaproteobacteria bacterium ADurb.Bin207]
MSFQLRDSKLFDVPSGLDISHRQRIYREVKLSQREKVALYYGNRSVDIATPQFQSLWFSHRLYHKA